MLNIQKNKDSDGMAPVVSFSFFLVLMIIFGLFVAGLTELLVACFYHYHRTMEHRPPSKCSGECSICLAEIRGAEVELFCGHQFHSQCLQKWLTYARTCPLCRTPIEEFV